ncbi:hypothetical protein Q7P37_005963 [Cladosporium fusiforme]
MYTVRIVGEGLEVEAPAANRMSGAFVQAVVSWIKTRDIDRINRPSPGMPADSPISPTTVATMEAALMDFEDTMNDAVPADARHHVRSRRQDSAVSEY